MPLLSTLEAGARAAQAGPRAACRRVLVLADQYHGPFGGTERQLLTLIEHLPAGWEAELWLLRKSPAFDETRLPVRTRVLDITSLQSLRTLWRIRTLARDVRAAGFDLVHSYMNDASVVGALLARRAGVPFVVSRRDLGFWQTPRWLQLLRRTNRFASAVIANADAVARHTARSEHVPLGMIHVVHNGQHPARFDVVPEQGLRERLGVPADAPIVGMLANVKALKRQDDLLDAFERLRAKHPELHVWFIGEDPGDDPPDQPKLAARIRARGLEGRAHIFRAEGNAIAVLKHLTVGVLCSETEGLSNSILEYLGCGLPVVATNVGGNPDLITDGENGLLYEAGDVGALTRHLDALLGDPARAAALGEAARARFDAEFTVRRMVEQTVAHYEEVLSDAGRAAAPELDVELVQDLDTLEALAPAWQALLRPGQLFAGPDWVLAALRHAPEFGTPCVLVAREQDGTLAGLLPLVRRGATVAFAGADLGGDHLDVVAAPERALAVAEAALARLEREAWSSLRLRHLAEDGALRLAVRRRRWRLPFRERISTVCPYLTVAGTFDDYLAAHPSSTFRRNVRRYAKRFLAAEGARVERVRAPEDVPGAIERFYALHEQRFRERRERSAVGAGVRAFHEHVATRAARSGRAALTFLVVGERDVACEYGFSDGHVRYAFQGGQDPESGVTSPGLVLRALILRDEVIGEGLGEYDFLDGAEAYKARWTTRVRRLFDVDVRRPSTLGRWRSFLGGLPYVLRDLWRPERATGGPFDEGTS